MHTLYKLAAMLYFIAALVGCHPSDRSIVVRTTANGTDLLYSKIDITADHASFHCLASHSGQCHYALFEHDCPASGACDMQPFKQLAIAASEDMDVHKLPHGFLPCVSADAKAMTSECLRQGRAVQAAMAYTSP
jgi:hypothetical protein